MPSKVFYNSACPVCNAGIQAQRKRMKAFSDKDIEWIDVHNNPDAVSEVATPLEQVRERLHVKDDSGKLNIGIDAFVCLWQQTPSQRWLAKLFKLPLIQPLSRMAYNGFAKLLYAWNRMLKHW